MSSVAWYILSKFITIWNVRRHDSFICHLYDWTREREVTVIHCLISRVLVIWCDWKLTFLFRFRNSSAVSLPVSSVSTLTKIKCFIFSLLVLSHYSVQITRDFILVLLVQQFSFFCTLSCLTLHLNETFQDRQNVFQNWSLFVNVKV